jgi:hypothetical protein
MSAAREPRTREIDHCPEESHEQEESGHGQEAQGREEGERPGAAADVPAEAKAMTTE